METINSARGTVVPSRITVRWRGKVGQVTYWCIEQRQLTPPEALNTSSSHIPVSNPLLEYHPVGIIWPTAKYHHYARRHLLNNGLRNQHSSAFTLMFDYKQPNVSKLKTPLDRVECVGCDTANSQRSSEHITLVQHTLWMPTATWNDSHNIKSSQLLFGIYMRRYLYAGPNKHTHTVAKYEWH